MLKPLTSTALEQVPDAEITKCSSWLEAFTARASHSKSISSTSLEDSYTFLRKVNSYFCASVTKNTIQNDAPVVDLPQQDKDQLLVMSVGGNDLFGPNARKVQEWNKDIEEAKVKLISQVFEEREHREKAPPPPSVYDNFPDIFYRVSFRIWRKPMKEWVIIWVHISWSFVNNFWLIRWRPLLNLVEYW